MSDTPVFISPKPALAIRPKYVFVDVEASGLYRGSFPIEIGVSDDGLDARSWLIRPDTKWTISDWSLESENVHGISQHKLAAEGLPVAQVATELARHCLLKTVISDAPDLDGKWLFRLFDAAGMEIPFVVRSFVDALCSELGGEHPLIDDWFMGGSLGSDVREVYPHPHRAEPDAVSMAADFRARVDPDFAKAVRTSASELRTFLSGTSVGTP